MTVQEMIDGLSKMDPNAPIEIAIRQYNKAHPIAYQRIEKPTSEFFPAIQTTHNGSVRINVSLPDDMRTSIRQPK